jgi:integrase
VAKGYIRERSAGSFNIGVYLGRDENGKQRYRWRTVRGSRRVAQAELNQMLADAQSHKLMPSSGLTVKTYLERWLADYAKPKVSGATYDRYKEIVERSLVPELGHRRLDQLKPMTIQSAYTKWLLRGGKRKGPRGKVKIGPLSARTVGHYHRVLHLAFKTAVRWQILPANPIDAVTPPRVTTTEPQVPSEADAMKMLAFLNDRRLAVPVLIALTTGLRRGEILALTWPDIDFKRGTLSITKALETTGDGDRVKETKTRRSRRTIPIPPITVEALAQLRDDQRTWRKDLGPGYVESDRVCVHHNGRPWTLDGLTGAYRKAAIAAGVKGRFHDLRHAHATWLLRAGVHPRIVAERLGHSSTVLTMDTYSHVLPGMQDAAVAQLEIALRAARIDIPLTKVAEKGGKP